MTDIFLAIIAIYAAICLLIIMMWQDFIEVRKWAKLFVLPIALIVRLVILPFKLLKWIFIND